MRRSGGLVVIAALLAAPGCHRVFKGKVTQPNPLSQPNETLRISEPITIITGDMELNMPQPAEGYGGSLMRNQRYPLQNRASFTVVSRDRLRFHVQLEHKWRDYANLKGWQAWIIDDKGRKYLPEAVEADDARHVVHMWDYETRSVQRDSSGYGDIVAINQDGHKRRQTLGSLSVFRGRGDYVFYDRNIFTPDVKSITLVVERRGVAFTFTWRFVDEGEGIGGHGELAAGLAPR
ncbi:MAG TPA: hypothetical protein VML75_29215 [Kofleriaceae bacterium]|nr:hypothetical protein [Kofleriaceae bacterium]